MTCPLPGPRAVSSRGQGLAPLDQDISAVSGAISFCATARRSHNRASPSAAWPRRPPARAAPNRRSMARPSHATAFAAAAQALREDFTPIDDFRASAAYRMQRRAEPVRALVRSPPAAPTPRPPNERSPRRRRKPLAPRQRAPARDRRRDLSRRHGGDGRRPARGAGAIAARESAHRRLRRIRRARPSRRRRLRHGRPTFPARTKSARSSMASPRWPKRSRTMSAAPSAPSSRRAMRRAKRAADLVQVDWEPLPAILSIADAIAAESWTSAPQRLVYGDPDAAFAKAPRRLTGGLDIGGQDHFYLETNIAIAAPLDEGQWHRVVLHPAPDRSAEARGARARRAAGRRDGGSAPHGRGLWRQGKPADDHRRHRRGLRRTRPAAR